MTDYSYLNNLLNTDVREFKMTLESIKNTVEYEDFIVSASKTLRQMSFEDYFGKNDFVNRLVSSVNSLRALIPKTGTLNNVSATAYTSALESMSNLIKNHLNVEVCEVFFDKTYNCYALNMTIGDAADRDILAHSEVVISKDGYRFKKPNGLSVYLGIGIPILLDPEITDAMFVAIMVHEIGHTIELTKNNTALKSMCHMWLNFLYSFSKNMMKMIKVGDFIGAVTTLLVNCVAVFITVFKPKASYGTEFTEASSDILKKGKVDYDVNSGTYTVDTGPDNNFWLNVLFFLMSPWYNILKFLYDILTKILIAVFSVIPIPILPGIIISFLQDPLWPLDAIIQGGLLRSARDSELAADVISSTYGLGPELSKVMYRFYRLRNKNVSEKDPIGFIIGANLIIPTLIGEMYSTHPSGRTRVKAIYESLAKELRDNKSLPPAAKRSIEADLLEIEKVYDTFIDFSTNKQEGRVVRGMLYSMFRGYIELKKDCKTSAEINQPVHKDTIRSVVSSVLTDKDVLALINS